MRLKVCKSVIATDSYGKSSTVSITSDRKIAHIALSIEGLGDATKLRFDVLDAALVDRGLDCGYHLVDNSIQPQDLANILQDLAHFYQHLKRGTPNDPSFPVDISFYELKPSESVATQYLPIDNTEKGNLYDSKSGIINLYVGVDSDAEVDEFGEEMPTTLIPYGLQVINNSAWNLYPALFYFDNSKFTIVSAYHPPLAKEEAESPLNVGESITIGYGVGGAGGVVPPFTFSLAEPKQKMEVGFFKLILSTNPIHLQHMVQDVPVFETARALVQRSPTQPRPTPPVSWASFNILVVQRLRE